MDRLKEEWNKVQIPEDVYLRARNLAWNKVNNPLPKRRYAWVAAVATTMVVIVIVASIRNQGEMQIKKAAVFPEQPSRLTESSGSPKSQSVDLASSPKKVSVERSISRKHMNTAADRHERVVVNFRLPESGAQMIWIMDSDFQLDGGAQ